MAGGTLLHCFRTILRLEEGHTQTTLAERELIARYAGQARRAVEIGVYEGVTSCVIAANLAEGGLLYAVDPFPAGRLGIRYGKVVARSLLRRRGVLKKVVFLPMLSWQAASQLEGPFDFVFVDGDHSWEGIERDWRDWAGRVRPGGHIALHDTTVPPHDPSVAELGSHRYFQDHVRGDPRFQRIDGVDSLNVLRRRQEWTTSS